MEKRFKKGLIVAKCYPFTLGHQYLIEKAATYCDKLFVMVCSLKRELILGEDRANWVKQTFSKNPNVIVIHCDAEVPQYPEECESTDEFYYRYWCPLVHSYVSDLEAVFTSEEYGDEFGRYLGVEHVLIDEKRIVFPVSGTSVRENIILKWNLLPKATQNYFKKKIVVMGPESTGKSTIVKKLAEHYNCDYVEEYGRTYTETKPVKELTEHDFEIIAVLHADQIRRKELHSKNMFLFVDTEAIITKVFGKLYLGRELDNKLVDMVIEEQNFDLVLLLTPEVNFINDGTRDEDIDRYNHYCLIFGELMENNVNFEVIGGEDYEERFNQCVMYVDELNKV